MQVNKKKWSLIALSVLYSFFILLTLNVIPVKVMADEGVRVAITTQAPRTGYPVCASVTGAGQEDHHLEWWVDGDKVSVGNDYIPTAADFESWITVKVIAEHTKKVLATDKIFFSRLPVVYIDTENGAPVDSRTDYVSAQLFVQGNAQYGAQYSGGMQIKGRGMTSWKEPKKPYKLKLDKKTDLFGAGKGKHYVLLANYLDASLMRGGVGFETGAQAGIVSTDSVWVDVVFNGQPMGNYQLCEHVRIGEQLIDIDDWEEVAEDAAAAVAKANPADFDKATKAELEDAMTEDLSWLTSGNFTFRGKAYDVAQVFTIPQSFTQGGYLFELYETYVSDPTHFVTDRGLGVSVRKPEFACTNDEMMDAVTDIFQRFEDAIYSVDGYNAQGEHYSQIADVDSLVGYWLTNEILSNEDAASRSRFCYWGVGGKLTFGPVWDFDISSYAYRSIFGPKGFNVTGTVVGLATKQDFFKELIDDPYFQMKAQEKYWQMHDYLEDLVRDDGVIDCLKEYLYESAVANEYLWTDKDFPRSFTGKKGDVAIYKQFLKERIAWLDGVFATQKQTSKNLCLPLSTNSFLPNATIAISMAQASADRTAHGADYLWNGEELHLTVKAPQSAWIYVNGLRVGHYSRKQLSQGIVLSGDLLTEKAGDKNVITVMTDGGKVNYITVKTAEKVESKYIPVTMQVCEEDMHSMDYIAARKATQSKYGLNECYYCNECGHYFADERGEKLLKAEQVILSVKTNPAPNGILHQVVSAVQTVFTLLFVTLLPVFWIFFKVV